MKKIFLAAALIVGVVASQFVAMSQAQAYTPTEGDMITVVPYACHFCTKRALVYTTSLGEILRDDRPYKDCPNSYFGDGSHLGIVSGALDIVIIMGNG
ncbi:MAG: hypothetical protein IKO05_02495 [Selenomonadaceae bacterium]|nr:hypothetical protein [Selenomonadaceae bacterium]